MKWQWLWPIALCLSGCPSTTAPPGSAGASDSRSNNDRMTASGSALAKDRAAANAGGQGGAEADGPLVVQMQVYQLTVPFGAISRNDEFWKHVDEARLDPATYDLLIRNGLRLGVGLNNDWKYFKELIDNYHATAQSGIAGVTGEGSIELAMKSGIDYQDVFYFDSHNLLWGRTFEHCDDLMALSFYPHQRAEGDTVIKLCPLVRGLRKEFVFSVRNEERVIELRRPELLIDLRATLQVQADHFLILGPSRISELPDSVGRTFLVKDGKAELVETVLVMVPKAYRLGADKIAVPVGPR